MSQFHDSEICRSILESLPSGLCVVDMQKRIVFWSDGAERITGHLRHDVIGHSCISEVLLHCDQPGCEFCKEDCPVARAIKTSHPTESIGFLHHKAGYEIPVRIRAVPVHNHHGSIIGAVETFEELQQAAAPIHRDDNLRLPGCVDEVTNVASHALMRSHLRRTLATFVEVQVPFGVLRLRLESLSHFRASLGPEAASSLLRVVARSLESTLWTSDFIGRWSDDQFLVILNGCREEALPAVRERVRRMLSGDGIEWWGERRSLPVAVGEASALPDDTVESLLERAQKSMEAASAWRTKAASASDGSSSSGSPAKGSSGS
jgi:diguanylate cyclase (GGDEF)-like protein/PAS domain S-box-containing protein